MRKVFWLGVLFALLLATTVGCAPGHNPSVYTPTEQGTTAGFWQGLWHGIIAPVTFILSLFSASVQIYEVHNNGAWYNLGFLLGMSIIFGGAGRGSGVKRSRH